MEENKYLIIHKNKDKTKDIQSYEIEGNIATIKYYNSDKKYDYKRENLIIENEPVLIHTENQIIYHKQIPLNGINRIIRFNEKVKVIYNNGYTKVYDYKDISIEETLICSENAQNILNYWTDISQYTGKLDDGRVFLKSEFDKLKVISNGSVLSAFINKSPLLKLEKDNDNIIFPFKFNLSQKKALENALDNNISVIEGPPGTGKTQTILNIIANLAIIQGKKVAVVSSNNSAIENIREKMAKYNYDFLVANLGKKTKREEFFKKINSFQLIEPKDNYQVEEEIKKIKEINSKLNELLKINNDRAKMECELSAFYLEREYFNKYYENFETDKIRSLSFFRETPEKIINFLIDNQIAYETRKQDTLFYKLKLFFKYFLKDFKKLNGNEMDIILYFQKKYYNLKIQELENRIKELDDYLKRNSFQELIENHESISKNFFDYIIYEKYSAMKNTEFKEKNFKYKFGEFINRFPIILSTTHSLRNCVPEGFLFDYLIIDEASQVDLVSASLALSCCKNIVIVGDSKQLPQIVDIKIKEKIKKDIKDKAYDYFEKNILTSILEIYKEDIPKRTLKEHYRCHPKIIEFCNKKYYDGDLIPFKQEKDKDIPLVIYHTAKGNHMRKIIKGEAKGTYNQRELDVIKDEILLNNEVITKNQQEIGVVTPYRKQATEAESTFTSDIECDTIHKYQGREKSVMIMSTVLDKSRDGNIGIKFVDNPNMVNVGVSRAINQFILVTHDSLFKEKGSEIKDLVRYMEYSTLDDKVIHSDVISVFDLLYNEYSDKLIRLRSRMLNKLKYKSENIMYTVLMDIMREEKYKMLDFSCQMYLKNIVNNTDKLEDEENRFIRNNSSVDFVVFYILNKEPIMAIEVDGFAYHENCPEQQIRDRKKDNIFEKIKIPLLRLKTNGSGEVETIRKKLDEVINLS